MTDKPSQLTFEALPPDFYPTPPRRIGALWRRLVAFLIDSLAVGFIGLFLGYFFYDLFMNLGPSGRLIGYCVGLFYFAIPESSFGNGQSLGKRLLLLQVVDREGERLSVERSLIRYTIFAVPSLAGGLTLPFVRTPSAAFLFLEMCIFGIGGASLYLMIFNRNTRQAVYDFLVRGYVAEARKDGPVTVHSIRKHHWFVAAAIFLVATVAGLVVPRVIQLHTLPELSADARQVEMLPGVQSAVVMRVDDYSHGARFVSLVVKVRCTIPNSDQEALANQIADSLITTDPTIDQYSTLRILLIRGYDIGIAHSSFSQTYSDNPAHWRQQFFAVPPQLPAH